MKRLVLSAILIISPSYAFAQGYSYGAPYGSYADRQNEIIEQQQRIIQQQQQMQQQMQQQQDMQQGYQDGGEGAGPYGTCGLGGSITYQQACESARMRYIQNHAGDGLGNGQAQGLSPNSNPFATQNGGGW